MKEAGLSSPARKGAFSASSAAFANTFSFGPERSRSTRLKLLAIALVTLIAACAKAPEHLTDPKRAGMVIDTTGADVMGFDSLPRDYLTPPGPPNPNSMWLPVPPVPIPASVRRTTVEAVFTVGPDGRITRISVTPMKDRRYARELIDSWRSLKFRPAKRADGTPTVGYYKLRFDF
jgi:hypothetical protein